MQSDDAAWTDPALMLIKVNDLKTYMKMVKADWTVRTFYGQDDLIEMLDDIWLFYDISYIAQTVSEMLTAFGSTFTGNGPPSIVGHTFLNRPLIESVASEMHFPVTDFLADIMVHEYKHREGHGEKAAFNAGTMFAEKLGDESLAQFSRDTKVKEIADLG